MRQDVRRIAVCGIFVLTAVLLVSGIRDRISVLKAEKLDTKEGVAAIQAMETREAAEVEARIEELEQQEEAQREAEKQEAEREQKSFKTRFENALVLGDSIAEGFAEFDILKESSVLASRGDQVLTVSERLDTIRTLNPGEIFLSYGMNDIPSTDGNTELFGENYRKALKELKKTLPDAKIYINSIFPVQEAKIAELPVYASLESYNEVLREVAEETGVTFLDNSALAKEEYYEQDGVHFKSEMYPVWLEKMAEESGL